MFVFYKTIKIKIKFKTYTPTFPMSQSFKVLFKSLFMCVSFFYGFNPMIDIIFYFAFFTMLSYKISHCCDLFLNNNKLRGHFCIEFFVEDF